MSEEKKQWISTTEAATIMKITVTSVGRLCKKGSIKCRQHGKGHRSIWEVWREDAENYERDFGGRKKGQSPNQ